MRRDGGFQVLPGWEPNFSSRNLSFRAFLFYGFDHVGHGFKALSYFGLKIW